MAENKPSLRANEAEGRVALYEKKAFLLDQSTQAFLKQDRLDKAVEDFYEANRALRKAQASRHLAEEYRK
jgi:hypothetical protein